MLSFIVTDFTKDRTTYLDLNSDISFRSVEENYLRHSLVSVQKLLKEIFFESEGITEQYVKVGKRFLV
jgi:hypothetical protein